MQFSAVLTDVSSPSVNWAVVEGAAGGTITTSGLYTAPSGSGTFHVSATSSADPTLSDTASVVVTAAAGVPPVLTPGTWANITPPGVPLLGHDFGSPWVEIDPTHPRTLYLCIDQEGLWRTTDGGSTWSRLGNPSAPAGPPHQTSYLDSPIAVRVDPGDSNHLYATQGVRGNTLGFWVSTDGGATWAWPQGFVNIMGTVGNGGDVTQIDVDPGDFKHILLGSHSPWKGLQNAGVLESQDGGNTWVAHAPVSTWASGSMGIHFLHDPTLGMGNAQTWLVAENFFWRTTDSGANWTKVSDFSVTHGGNEVYYSKTGVIYTGAFPYPVRSSDNGVTWQQLTNGPAYAYYYSVQGDGTTLYTQHANTGTSGGNFATAPTTLSAYLTSPESDGMTWTSYQGGAQKFIDGPFLMRFDSVNRIMYSANWDAGLWALKVLSP